MISRTAAASTMFLMTNFLIALSLGTQRAQLVHRTAFTCPRLCLQRPPLRRFLVYRNIQENQKRKRLELGFEIKQSHQSHLFA